MAAFLTISTTASLSDATSPTPRATPERAAELKENLAEIRSRVKDVLNSLEEREPLIVAVSKYKPAADIFACYEEGQRDFGENYVQELVDKSKELPRDIRWHFIGTLQTNKSKILASIPNLYAMQTLASIKAAGVLNNALTAERESNPLNVLLQVNTSGEDAKSGLPPLDDRDGKDVLVSTSDLAVLAQHVIERCPRLRLQGLMTIGSLSESLSDADDNRDFKALKCTRDSLETHLRVAYPDGNRWGESGRLLLSMGMSSDFEAALKSGSDIVRVGTGIFGQRHKKGEK
ncbi:hypothetical protein DFH11DRAFT_1511607 [Phellopilus nigrolimitatus]|nr:hypothetical protein DFH11DRAFT_1511607 [Phellopilus nigrolimitatus]